MQDIIKKTKFMLTFGFVLQIIWTGLHLLIQRFPERVLAMFNSPVELLDRADVMTHPLIYIAPFAELGVLLILFLLLHKQCAQPTSASGGILVLTLLSTIILFLISLMTHYATNYMLAHFEGSNALAAYGMVQTAISWASVIKMPVVPLFAAVAGINWCRWKQSAQQ